MHEGVESETYFQWLSQAAPERTAPPSHVWILDLGRDWGRGGVEPRGSAGGGSASQYGLGQDDRDPSRGLVSLVADPRECGTLHGSRAWTLCAHGDGGPPPHGSSPVVARPDAV